MISAFRLSWLAPVGCLLAAWPVAAWAEPDDDDGSARPVTEIIVTAHRLDTARAEIDPTLGASVYTLSNETVESRPGGETVSVSRLLLQAPGVSTAGSGEIRIRGSDRPVQYRINNLIVPDGFSDLGESLSARLADRVELITGALPAQYGLQSGGVVNITTKSGVYQEGGQLELYGGGSGELEPAFEYAGDPLGVNLFVSGSYLRSQRGLDTPEAGAPLHDRTDQIEGFAYLDRLLGDEARISLILGASNERFQLPNRAGLNAATFTGGSGEFQRPLVVQGSSNFQSEALDASQRLNSRFALLAYQWTSERSSLQIAGFTRYSSLALRSAGLGDLLFTGLDQSADDGSLATGLQAEGFYDLSSAHRLRYGIVINVERGESRTRSRALALDSNGKPLSDEPVTFARRLRSQTRQTSLYVQDEWRPSKTLTVNYGLRFDQVDSEGRASPRLNLVWRPEPDTILHAGYARYFVPAPDDLHAAMALDLAGTTGGPPGASVSPPRAETDDDYDIGLQRTVGPLTLGVDGYWREADNLIVQARYGPSRLEGVTNFHSARLAGLELSLTYAFDAVSGWFNLTTAEAVGRDIISSQFAFTPAQLDASRRRDIPLDQDQTWTISGGGAYRLDELRVSAAVTYGSGLPRTAVAGAPNGARVGETLQVDLAMVYRWEVLTDRPLDVRFDLINAFDRANSLRDGSSLGGDPARWGPRRGVFVGLEQAF